jgi:hypothetical protein
VNKKLGCGLGECFAWFKQSMRPIMAFGKYFLLFIIWLAQSSSGMAIWLGS